MKPFIILALPRTGTKMLADALCSHPDIPMVRHEFRGTEAEYWEHPYVLANEVSDWMLDDRITRIHVYRENAVAGARSMLLMSNRFPDGVVTLPVEELEAMARKRNEWDEVLYAASHFKISYEQLCRGKEVTILHESELLCEWLGLEYHPLTTNNKKSHSPILKNEDEVKWLTA